MTELRGTLAGVDHTTDLRKAPRGSVRATSTHFDGLILATDFATVVLGVSLIQPLLYLTGGGAAPLQASGSIGPGALGAHAVMGLASAAMATWYFWVHGHYVRRRSSWDCLGDIAFISGCLLLAELTLRLQGLLTAQSVLSVALFWGSLAGLLIGARLAARRYLELRGLWLRPAVILGGGTDEAELARTIAADRDLGVRVTHVLRLPSRQSSQSGTLPSLLIEGQQVQCLEAKDPLAELFLRFRGHVIVVAPRPEELPVVDKLLPTITTLCPTVGFALPSVEVSTTGTTAQVLMHRDLAVVWLQNRLLRPEWRLMKRAFDVLASATILLLTSPLLALSCFLIWRQDGAPVFFYQERVGRNGRVFRMIKFRTMVRNAEEILAQWKTANPELWASYRDNNFKLNHDPRVTRLGCLLRRTSIDELPQLWNVLKGDMSLVGPRPLLRREVGDYGGNIQLYLTARPGLSGLWQVSGRSETEFADRARLDGWYVRNWSFWYDVVILFKTVRTVLSRSGAY